MTDKALMPTGSAHATWRASSGWDGYWEGLTEASWLYREQSEIYVANLTRAMPVEPWMRVLDFGCGVGFVAQRLAPLVKEVCFWDAAASMRRLAEQRLRHISNARPLDLSCPIDAFAGPRFDLILVNSVVQYMSREEFAGWLAAWHRLLAAGGGVVVSDIIRPERATWNDVVDLLRFGAGRGRLWRALRQLVGQSFTYWKYSRACPLTAYSRADLEQTGREAELVVRFLPANLTQFSHRLTAHFVCGVSGDGIAPIQSREAREIAVGRAEGEPVLDREGGEIRVGNQIPLNAGSRQQPV